MPATEYHQFTETVWQFYADHARSLPWRDPSQDGTLDPYKIMVSEIMLQQTQVTRVIPKYLAFLERFPNLQTLAAAPLHDVLSAWSGLGYNRRAKYLQQAAQMVVSEMDSIMPSSVERLATLPGVGVNTAGAIMAYGHNQPVVFIETNIRTVYIHHFFRDQDAVSDADLKPLIAATVDRDEPRQWYWALMDYGSHLKQTTGNASRQSKTYVRQSTFKGSKRQIRGQVIARLLQGAQTEGQLTAHIPDSRLLEVLKDLSTEKMVSYENGEYRLAA